MRFLHGGLSSSVPLIWELLDVLAVRGEALVSSVPGCPALVGPGPTACRVESVARWHGGCCQPSLAWVLKLASAHRTLQPQECNSRPLPWQSRHSQTGRMCGGGWGGGDGGAETQTEVVRWRGGCCFMHVCVCVLWTAAWVMVGVRMSVHSPSYVRTSLTGCHVWEHTD